MCHEKVREHKVIDVHLRTPDVIVVGHGEISIIVVALALGLEDINVDDTIPAVVGVVGRVRMFPDSCWGQTLLQKPSEPTCEPRFEKAVRRI